MRLPSRLLPVLLALGALPGLSDPAPAAPAASAGSASSLDLPELPLETYTLGNGLKIILHEDHSTPVVAVSIWYRVGSKNERPGRSGFAHLFEHMMFQGSAHQDEEFFGPLQEVGARLNGSTNEDRTNYWEVVPSNHLERALLMEADRMGWLLPALTQEKLDTQRDVVRNERRQSENQPYSVFRLNANQNLYPMGHPYDHSVIGSHQDLQAASVDDVKDFFRSYYTPNNATLCLAGDFNPRQAKDWIETYFAEIPPGPPVTETSWWVPEITREKRIRMEDRVQLVRAYYLWPTAPAFTPGDAELQIAAKVLGGGKTSRLYKRLVYDAPLAQDVSAEQESRQISSTFTVQVTLRPGTDLAQVETIVDEEIERLRRSGPARDELAQVKTEIEANFVKGLQRVGSWDGKAERFQRYNHYVGTPDYIRQDLERLVKPTPEAVRKAVAQWIGSGRVVFEVHPAGTFTAEAEAPVDRRRLPEGGSDPTLELPSLQHGALPTGLALEVMEQRELPLVQVQLVFRSGYATDPPGRSGLANLTGEMLLEGAAKLGSIDFANALERLGTELTVRTQADYTVLSLTSLHKHLDASMALLADAVLRPAFRPEDFERKREQRLVDVRREPENPTLTAEKVMLRVIYGAEHPYGHLSTGTEAALNDLRLVDVARFAAAHYTPQNAVLLAVGEISMGELETLADRHFGLWSGPAPAPPALPALPARTQPTVYLVDRPGATQSSIVVAQPGLARSDPQWNALAVLNRALGGMFTSRLNLNLREDKGYTYGARSALSENASTGQFSMSARVQTEVTAPALTEFLKELQGVAGKRPLGEEELAYAKSSIVRGYPLQFETNSEVSGALTEMVVFGLPEDHLSRYPRDIAAVSRAETGRAAEAVFRPGAVAVIIVGDLAKIEAPVTALRVGPVVHLDAQGAPAPKAARATSSD